MRIMLKKIIALFLSILILLSFVPVFASSQNVVYEDFSDWINTKSRWSTLLTNGSVPNTSYYSLETSGSNPYLDTFSFKFSFSHKNKASVSVKIIFPKTFPKTTKFPQKRFFTSQKSNLGVNC